MIFAAAKSSAARFQHSTFRNFPSATGWPRTAPRSRRCRSGASTSMAAMSTVPYLPGAGRWRSTPRSRSARASTRRPRDVSRPSARLPRRRRFARVLDLGCGSGILSIGAARAAPSAHSPATSTADSVGARAPEHARQRAGRARARRPLGRVREAGCHARAFRSGARQDSGGVRSRNSPRRSRARAVKPGGTPRAVGTGCRTGSLAKGRRSGPGDWPSAAASATAGWHSAGVPQARLGTPLRHLVRRRAAGSPRRVR